jgi:Protein of unknown function (DUF2911)
MRIVFFLYLLFFSTVLFAQHEQHSQAATSADDMKKSLAKEEHAQIGDTHISILYTAPVVKGRVIWGGLVAYDQVWVTGAHKATSFEIDREFAINKKKIPAGKYAIFTIPGKDKWIFILNKKWNQHLADEYDTKEDVIRIEVKPKVLSALQERLNYSITELSEKDAVLSISWEKLKINIPFALN